MKLHIIYLALCWVSSHSVYISRMTTLPRMRPPTAFRPGVTFQRPWAHQRIMASPSHRTPYVVYRSPAAHRYVKTYNYTPGPRTSIFNGGPWKTTARMPFPSATPEYDYVRTAATQQRLHADGGAIHTIPAPNLSLAEKPIVVLESNNLLPLNSVTSEAPKPTYEVTEKYIDQSQYPIRKIVDHSPAGFTKTASISAPELSTLMRNNLALQLASEYGLSAIALPPQSHLVTQPAIPIQGYQVQTSQAVSQQGIDSLFIPPNALYAPDQAFLQKLQNQLLTRFPAVEFVPYHPQQEPQVQAHAQPHAFVVNNDHHHPQQEPQVQAHAQPHAFVVNNDHHNHHPLSVIPIDDKHKNVVRETQESVVTLLPPKSQPVPQPVVQPVANVTEKIVQVQTTSQQPLIENVTVHLLEAQSEPPTTTIRYVIETSSVSEPTSAASSSEEQKTTPIFYAQIGQAVENAIANGFYNDVRAAAALAQAENAQPQGEVKIETAQTSLPVVLKVENVTTTTMNPDLQNYFVQKVEKDENNQTINDIKPLLGVPFGKTENVKVAYTLVRTDDKDQKVAKDGTVYAGQIVEATISEDQDFNKEKADMLSRRPPLRIFNMAEKRETSKRASSTTPKITVVKAKIPPRSKLTFDEKTGEPILRIYASYIDTPPQKDFGTSKQANVKQVKETTRGSSRHQELSADWKTNTVKALDKPQTTDQSRVTEFGLKLRSRMDDIIPIFDDSDE